VKKNVPSAVRFATWKIKAIENLIKGGVFRLVRQGPLILIVIYLTILKVITGAQKKRDEHVQEKYRAGNHRKPGGL